MKNTICLLILALCIAATGLCTATAVSIENDVNVGDIIHFGGIDWLVLDIQDGKALIMSERILEYRAYNEAWEKNITWEVCTLRQHLNGSFYQTQFSNDEQARIVETVNTNPDNPWYAKGKGGKDTRDKVFLLSPYELVQYFGNSGQIELANRPANWSQSDGILDDEFNSMRITKDNDGKACFWWLRSAGDSNGGAVQVNSWGSIIIGGGSVHNNDEVGIRPALWINLETEH